jgi:hypothetical protein
MGLDIRAISKIATKRTDPEQYEFNELMDAEIGQFYINPDFASHTSDYGLEPGVVDYIQTDESTTESLRAGSYSGYNKFRNLLSLAVLGVKAETAWENVNTYSDKPLWDIINFSDCEGAIDASTSEKLRGQFQSCRTVFEDYITKDTDIGDMDTEHYMETYDGMIKCFALGSEDGVVIYG